MDYEEQAIKDAAALLFEKKCLEVNSSFVGQVDFQCKHSLHLQDAQRKDPSEHVFKVMRIALNLACNSDTKRMALLIKKADVIVTMQEANSEN